MRMRGDIDGSQAVLQACFDKHKGPVGTSAASPHKLAALYRSQANNYAYRFKFREAHGLLRRWTPSVIMSQEQSDLLWQQLMCVGRILRGEGQFEAAQR